MKREGCFFLYSSVRVGTWREYDDKGSLIKVTDEDAKFKHLAMRPKDVLMWMQRQGWINLSTGKGQQTMFSNTPFDIYLYPEISIRIKRTRMLNGSLRNQRRMELRKLFSMRKHENLSIMPRPSV